MTLPRGAQAIIDTRKRGMKPADMLIVSTIGPLAERNTTILANPSASYDWRWIIGLKVCVFVDSTSRKLVKSTLLEIGKACPEWLSVWDVDQYAGAYISALPEVETINKPQSQWRYRLDTLPWLDCENKDFEWSSH